MIIKVRLHGEIPVNGTIFAIHGVRDLTTACTVYHTTEVESVADYQAAPFLCGGTLTQRVLNVAGLAHLEYIECIYNVGESSTLLSVESKLAAYTGRIEILNENDVVICSSGVG